MADANAATGVAYFIVADVDPTISFDPQAELVANYDINGIWLAGTTAVIVLALTGGGDTVTLTMPVVQYREVPEGNRDGVQIYDATGQVCNSSGDDAITIATS
jgi:hypothetical protein